MGRAIICCSCDVEYPEEEMVVHGIPLKDASDKSRPKCPDCDYLGRLAMSVHEQLANFKGGTK